MRERFLWVLLALGTLLWLVRPAERQAAPLLHLGSRDGTGILENFAYPVALVVQGGQIWVVDHNNNRILTVRGTTLQVIAGNGQPEASGDGGPATQAGMFPLGLIRDPQGNLYIADHYNHRVRRISPTGRITTITGTGRAGKGGDGGPATQAELNDPTGLALSPQGILYIADQDNGRIRVVERGLIRTLPVGPGLGKPWSLAFDCQGRLLIVDLGRDRIWRWDGRGLTVVAGVGTTGGAGDGGAATLAQLSSPVGVAVRCRGSQEELFIADSGNDRVRRVDPQGQISTFAGTGSFGMSGDGGPATQAQLASPYAVAVDEQGQIYIADANNNRVRRVNRWGIIETVLSPEGVKN